MTELIAAELAKVIRDLLRIAKVAMPPKTFGEDPRVTAATAVLESLEGRSSARVPNVTSRPPQLDIARLAQRRAVEESAAGIAFMMDLPWDLVEAMTAMPDIPADPSDAMEYIARDWLTSQGTLPSGPASSN